MRAQPRTPAHRSHRSVSVALARRYPLAETVDAFERLRAAGKIVRWGVSNFDVDDMRRACGASRWQTLRDEPGSLQPVRAWNRSSFARAYALSMTCSIMAYSPLHQGAFAAQPKIGNSCRVARHHARAARDRVAARAKRHHRDSAIVERRPRARVSRRRRYSLVPRRVAEIDAAFPPPRTRKAARDAVDAAHRRFAAVAYKLRVATTFIG